MAHVSKQDAAWLEEHGRYDTDGWICKKTGKDIRYAIAGRSIHILGLAGGTGEVCQVMHLYCSGCNPDFKPPEQGTPIQEDDLIEVS